MRSTRLALGGRARESSLAPRGSAEQYSLASLAPKVASVSSLEADR
jgi:hypothetical protein